MNNIVWQPVEEDYWGYLNVERMGSVVTVAVEAGLEMDKGYIIAPLPPNVRVCRAVSLPQPDWADVPEWAQWGAIEPDGNVSWHETEPQVVLFYWFGDGRNERAIGVFVDIPLGIDWRLLKFQRPQEEPA